NNELKGIRASKDGPRINHLFFADDALLFVRNQHKEVDVFMKILDNFSRMSGQSINLEKSMVYFSPNTSASHRLALGSLLKMKVVDKIDSYLGLPIPAAKKRSSIFKSILDRMACRINSYLHGPEGGDRGDPGYDMSGLVGRGEKRRGWSILNWDRMCHPKGMGGLGFRDLRLFNITLLGRQVWRLIHCKDTLCYKVLSAKYFPDGNVFLPKCMDKPCFTWQSIAQAAKILNEGFGWTVGDGKNINIWHDNWGLEGLSGKSICMDKSMVKEVYVRDLFNESKDGWDRERVLMIYGDFMRDQICNIPIIHNGPNDRRTWFHNPHGKIIWKLKTLPKIRIFCWRIGHNILPTYEKISSIRPGFVDICPRCGKERESLIHALKDCPKARKVLEIGGLDSKLLNGNYLRCVDWIEEVARVMDIKAVFDFITVLWNVWNSRNNSIFRGVEEDAKVIWDRAASLSKDFRIFNLLEDPVLPRKTNNKAWKKPNQDTIKINFDAAVYGMSAWYGLVARDADGFVHGGRVGFVNKELHTEWAELQSMEESIYFTRSKKWNSVELESDCASLVNRFNCRQEDLTMLGH
ncbi:hypothetical protein Goklo_007316, partial [Gossypium klotzschianum]|nr:hypothetical protein [Gossypium klotzschianum]